MKKLIFALSFALMATGVAAQVLFEQGSTDALREMAAKTGKLVFIDLYASWCPPCRLMEKQVFAREDVGEFMNERFVSAKFDTDKAVGQELLKRYGSGSIPTFLIFDTAGDLLGRIQGASSAEEFMESVRIIISRQKPKPKK